MTGLGRRMEVTDRYYSGSLESDLSISGGRSRASSFVTGHLLGGPVSF